MELCFWFVLSKNKFFSTAGLSRQMNVGVIHFQPKVNKVSQVHQESSAKKMDGLTVIV